MSTVPVNKASLNADWARHCAKITVFTQDEDPVSATSFAASLTGVLETLKSEVLDQLTIQVNIAASESRSVANLVLQKLWDTNLGWDTLEVIMPSHVLGSDNMDYRADFLNNKDSIYDRVLNRLTNHCVVYKGADENVPWPWLDLAELSRFSIRSLQLQQQITSKQFRALVQNANRDGIQVGLQLHVDGVNTNGPTDHLDVREYERAGLSRLQKLDLGLVDISLELKSLLLSWNVHKSITELKAQVLRSMHAMNVHDAMEVCDKLETTEIKCELSQIIGIAFACMRQGLDTEGSRLVDGLMYALVTARKSDVQMADA